MFGKYQVHTHSGKQNSKKDPTEYAKTVEKAGAGEILLNSIDRDGTWSGFEIDLTKSITNAVNIPIIAVGGAGNLDHISEAVQKGGSSAVALGSMAVYQGKNLGVLINFPARDRLENII